MMPWYFGVVESRHELQNPTSPEKIRLLGERLQLGPESRVLDVGSGRGGPAILLARTFGCRITCIEKAEGFDAAARERARDAGVDQLLEFVHADAADVPLEPGRFDVVLCLGAAFIWNDLAGALAALAPAARSFVAVGEPYWRSWPVPDTVDPEWRGEFMTLRGNVDAFEAEGLAPVTIIDASPDDWDRYETLHWLVAEEWLREHPIDPDAEGVLTQVNLDRDRYLRWQRELLGWSIIVGRKS